MCRLLRYDTMAIWYDENMVLVVDRESVFVKGVNQERGQEQGTVCL